MIPLKRNFSYLVLDDAGQIASSDNGLSVCPEAGAWFLDTRVLSHYAWDLSGFHCVHQETYGSRKLVQYLTRFEAHKQDLLLVRTFEISEFGFVDQLELVNDDSSDHEFFAHVRVASDFADIFEVRNPSIDNEVRDIAIRQDASHYQAMYVAPDGESISVFLDLEHFRFDETLSISSRSSKTLQVRARFESSIEVASLPDDIYDGWLQSGHIEDDDRIYQQAALDLQDLLLATKDGLTIAAGIPWFVTPFGRDSIITSWFLLDVEPRLAAGTLRFLAANQGKKHDEFRDEQPGKILHEIRYSELSRIGKLPFHTYYGTADATSLFIILLHDYYRATNDDSLVTDMIPNLEAALNWMASQTDERGLIVFEGNEWGLTIQSWKDSHDSLSYSDGRLGEGALAVAEVQGYAYAAWSAAAEIFAIIGEQSRSRDYMEKAKEFRDSFDRHYWMPQHDNYAIALDAQGRQLDVNNSDSGHLLWSGIVKENRMEPLVNRLFMPDMWCERGLRTLSKNEVRYNPISYHNGSVWPHDTAMFAAGLKRYGLMKEFAVVREAMMEVARHQPDKRMPELFAGYASNERPVLPYLEACRPQAWSAAALVYLMHHG